MALPIERADGYTTEKVAELWNTHISEAHDPFRENPGGLYDQIKDWVEKHSLGEGTKVIDLCCGNGITTKIASSGGAHVVGIDISKPLIAIARKKYQMDTGVSFWDGDAANLFWISNKEMNAGMMINGIFHLSPGVMEGALVEIARVSRGPILLTNVAPEANEFFSGAFENQERFLIDENDDLGPTTLVYGNPSVSGPNGTRIQLENTPFYWHPMPKLERAFNKAGLVVIDYKTFGPTSDVGGPEGLNLFAEIQLEHIK